MGVRSSKESNPLSLQDNGHLRKFHRADLSNQRGGSNAPVPGLLLESNTYPSTAAGTIPSQTRSVNIFAVGQGGSGGSTGWGGGGGGGVGIRREYPVTAGDPFVVATPSGSRTVTIGGVLICAGYAGQSGQGSPAPFGSEGGGAGGTGGSHLSDAGFGNDGKNGTGGSGSYERGGNGGGAGGYVPAGTGGGATGYYTPTGGFSDPEGGGGVGIDPAFFRGDGTAPSDTGSTPGEGGSGGGDASGKTGGAYGGGGAAPTGPESNPQAGGAAGGAGVVYIDFIS